MEKLTDNATIHIQNKGTLNRLMKLEEISVATYKPEVLSQKLSKSPEKEALIRIPLVVFAYETENNKLVVAKMIMDQEPFKLQLGYINIDDVMGMSMEQTSNIISELWPMQIESDTVKATMEYLIYNGIDWKDTWVTIKWGGEGRYKNNVNL